MSLAPEHRPAWLLELSPASRELAERSLDALVSGLEMYAKKRFWAPENLGGTFANCARSYKGTPPGVNGRKYAVEALKAFQRMNAGQMPRSTTVGLTCSRCKSHTTAPVIDGVFPIEMMRGWSFNTPKAPMAWLCPGCTDGAKK